MAVYTDGKNWSDRTLAKYPAAPLGDNSRYYKMTKPDGTIVQEAVKLDLLNTVTQPGMPASAGNLNSILAAKNITTGTANAFILAQEGFLLEDGAQIVFRVHTMPIPNPDVTINVNNTGNIPIKSSKGRPLKGAVAGSWITAVYSSALNFFVLQGEGGDGSGRYGNEIGQISTLELMLFANFNPYYRR
jgi:hypothetical protein